MSRSSVATCGPATQSPTAVSGSPRQARFIPKGFQPIAGGERSDTTGQRTHEPVYPEGIAALRVAVTSHRLVSLRDTTVCGDMNRWCRCAQPPAMGCDPSGVGRYRRCNSPPSADGTSARPTAGWHGLARLGAYRCALAQEVRRGKPRDTRTSFGCAAPVAQSGHPGHHSIDGPSREGLTYDC